MSKSQTESRFDLFAFGAGGMLFAWAITIIVFAASVGYDGIRVPGWVGVLAFLAPCAPLLLLYKIHGYVTRRSTKALGLCFAAALLEASREFKKQYGELTIEAATDRDKVAYRSTRTSHSLDAFIMTIRGENIRLDEVVPTSALMNGHYAPRSDNESDPRRDILRMIILYLELSGTQMDARPVYFLPMPADREAHRKAKDALEGLYINGRPTNPPSPISESRPIYGYGDMDDPENTLQVARLSQEGGHPVYPRPQEGDTNKTTDFFNGGGVGEETAKLLEDNDSYADS